jgi:hypothetical protein
MSHEIIVYRNPMEKMMWDFWMGPVGSVIMMWVCSIAMVALLLYVVHAMLRPTIDRLLFKHTDWYRKRVCRRAGF